ncbi:MAG: hypothetical protein AAGI71_10160 [Bacteroidota bacterium]
MSLGAARSGEEARRPPVPEASSPRDVSSTSHDHARLEVETLRALLGPGQAAPDGVVGRDRPPPQGPTPEDGLAA